MEWAVLIPIVLCVLGLLGGFLRFLYLTVQSYNKRVGDIEAKVSVLETKTEGIVKDIDELKDLVKELTDIKVEISHIRAVLDIIVKKGT